MKKIYLSTAIAGILLFSGLAVSAAEQPTVDYTKLAAAIHKGDAKSVAQIREIITENKDYPKQLQDIADYIAIADKDGTVWKKLGASLPAPSSVAIGVVGAPTGTAAGNNNGSSTAIGNMAAPVATIEQPTQQQTPNNTSPAVSGSASSYTYFGGRHPT
jgi:hypothetical protein